MENVRYSFSARFILAGKEVKGLLEIDTQRLIFKTDIKNIIEKDLKWNDVQWKVGSEFATLLFVIKKEKKFIEISDQNGFAEKFYIDAKDENEITGALSAVKRICEESARLEAERRQREEVERLEAERRQREEEARLEVERRQREESARLEAERRQREEAERLEAERRQREEAARLEEEKKLQENLSREFIQILKTYKAKRAETEKRQREETERLEAERKLQEKLRNDFVQILRIYVNESLNQEEYASRLKKIEALEKSVRVIIEKVSIEKETTFQKENQLKKHIQNLECEIQNLETDVRIKEERALLEKSKRQKIQETSLVSLVGLGSSKTADNIRFYSEDCTNTDHSLELARQQKKHRDRYYREKENVINEDIFKIKTQKADIETLYTKEIEVVDDRINEYWPNLEQHIKDSRVFDIIASSLETLEKMAKKYLAYVEREQTAIENLYVAKSACLKAEISYLRRISDLETKSAYYESRLHKKIELYVQEQEAARLEAERRQCEEAERLEAERRQREEEARLEAERRQCEEAERLEAERRQREEEERLEAERRQREEAERLEAERRQREEAERLEAEKKQSGEFAQPGNSDRQKIKQKKEEFLKWCLSKGYKYSTAKGYVSAVGAAEKFLKSHNICDRDIIEITSGDVITELVFKMKGHPKFNQITCVHYIHGMCAYARYLFDTYKNDDLTVESEIECEEEERLEAERRQREEEERLEAERRQREEEERLEAERRQREEEERLEAERRQREEEAHLEAERRRREEAERLEAERRQREEERFEAERRQREEAVRLEAERRQREEAARLEAERRQREEEARLEAERRQREEAVRLEAERRQREEAARLEAERRQRKEAERLEAERKKREQLTRLVTEKKQFENEFCETEQNANVFSALAFRMANKTEYSYGYEILGRQVLEYFNNMYMEGDIAEYIDDNMSDYDALVSEMEYYGISKRLCYEFENMISDLYEGTDSYNKIISFIEVLCMELSGTTELLSNTSYSRRKSYEWESDLDKEIMDVRREQKELRHQKYEKDYKKVLDYICSEHLPVTKAKIESALPGVNKNALRDVLVNENKVLNFYRTYIWFDNLNITDQDVEVVNRYVKMIVSDYDTHHITELYEVLNYHYSDFLKRNMIDTPHRLFSVVQVISKSIISSERPYIASGICFAFILLSSFTSFREGEIPLTVILVAAIYLGQQIYEGIAIKDDISNMAHIFGGIVGGITGFSLNKKSKYGM